MPDSPNTNFSEEGRPTAMWERDQEINIKEVFRVLFRRWALIVTVTLSCATAATVYALNLPFLYRAETSVFPQTENNSDHLRDVLDRLPFGGPFNKGNTNNTLKLHIALLESRTFSNEFIEKNKLLPHLFPELWNPKRRVWEDKKGHLIPPPTLEERYIRFSKIKTVAKALDGDHYIISIELQSPQIAAQTANKLVQQFNDKLRKQAISDSESKIRYLSEQEKRTSLLKIREAIFSQIEFELKNKMVATLKEDFAFKVIDPAIAPQNPSSPEILKIGAFGLGVGMLLSFILIFAIQG